MSAIWISNTNVWDGTSDAAYPASVKIEGERIAAIVRDGSAGPVDGDTVIDGSGMTLMPGMVEGHAHPSFVGIDEPWQLGQIGPEEHMLRTAANLKLLLDHGFTSIFEAASAKPALGVTARNAINEGLIPGPRMLAGSPEITVTAGLGDARLRHLYQESFGIAVDGPIEMRRVARECVRDDVDVIKINVSGDEFVAHARGEITPLDDDEMAELMKVARTFGKKTAAHARSPKSVLMSVKHGVDCIYHCDFADDEALDAVESVKDKVFVGPAFGLVHNATREGERVGLTKEIAEAMQLPRKFEACCATYHEMRKRGIRVVVGGDYGFNVTPMGQNARDIDHFVRYFGYSPVEALKCATSVGAQLMDMADETGQVKEGFLADLLLVDGDPTTDVSLLQHQKNLAMIMKGGALHKDPRKAG